MLYRLSLESAETARAKIKVKFDMIFNIRSDIMYNVIMAMRRTQKSKLQVTTIRVPASLYNEAKAVVASGADEANSLNDLIVDSLRERLLRIQEARLDAKFAEMKNDRRYQEQAVRIATEFEHSDWDALKTVEKG
jgi:hypothetical protein